MSNKRNPAYRRHQLSRPMLIVGPIQFWRGCVIYPEGPEGRVGENDFPLFYIAYALLKGGGYFRDTKWII